MKISRALHLFVLCPLCGGSAGLFFEMPQKIYYQCKQCSGVFLEKGCFVSEEAEKRRYEEHNNNIDDPGYQRFVEPIVSRIQEKFTREHQGLDYGAGTGPVASMLLRKKGYSIELYDPYFWNNPEALIKKYDFIICCEVIEHFKFPNKEFALLKSLLSSKGALFCMTELYSEKTDFRNWYYKNDPTHIFFYHQNTLRQIKTMFDFSFMENSGRLVQFAIEN